ncbi:protein kinase C-binding protein 1-like isoform X2 [Mya arenaria]|uniref:protein kinase C-binding protein 1-like isoform X2 n=1 Tax=Mya arenaria TaxID=6604 RepID=UPI0022E8D07F|nr:protein kinase C-binding protein 1-like isoform X2 [Mya arenaria]
MHKNINEVAMKGSSRLSVSRSARDDGPASNTGKEAKSSPISTRSGRRLSTGSAGPSPVGSRSSTPSQSPSTRAAAALGSKVVTPGVTLKATPSRSKRSTPGSAPGSASRGSVLDKLRANREKLEKQGKAVNSKEKESKGKKDTKSNTTELEETGKEEDKHVIEAKDEVDTGKIIIVAESNKLSAEKTSTEQEGDENEDKENDLDAEQDITDKVEDVIDGSTDGKDEKTDNCKTIEKESVSEETSKEAENDGNIVIEVTDSIDISSEDTDTESEYELDGTKKTPDKQPEHDGSKRGSERRRHEKVSGKLDTVEVKASELDIEKRGQSETKSSVDSKAGSKTPITMKTEPDTKGATPGSAGIRTRLKSGSIQMNGTMTISAAKEKADMENIVKQITKIESSPPAKPTPAVTKKRPSSQTPSAIMEVVTVDHPPPKKRKIGRNNGSGQDNCNDYFCWLCHKEGTLVCCELCPRVYHSRCLGLSEALPQDWVCPECEKIMRAECVDTRSKAMEMLTIDQLCTLLKYALDRMKHVGSEPFQRPVDLNAVRNYSDYVYHPMDLTMMEKNIKKKQYGCTEAFLADAKWILHNCIIYNGAVGILTNSAKMIIKICKHEMNEIELCPDCYLNSCVRKNDEWFSETCRVPHTLVWAKLKGYPFWPSKALRESDGQVDVRFFGAHDRSWVPPSQCFLLSKNIPTSLQKGKRNQGLDMAIRELNIHIKKLRERFGNFEYAPFRTPYDKSDSYKPVIVHQSPKKPSTTSVQRQSSSTGSMYAKPRPNIISKRSAMSKTATALRNKYSAMVSLKKIDLSPDKNKRFRVAKKSDRREALKADEEDDDESDNDDGLDVDDGEADDNMESDGEENETNNVAVDSTGGKSRTDTDETVNTLEESRTDKDNAGTTHEEIITGKDGSQTDCVTKTVVQMADKKAETPKKTEAVHASKNIVDRLASKIKALQEMEEDNHADSIRKTSNESQKDDLTVLNSSVQNEVVEKADKQTDAPKETEKENDNHEIDKKDSVNVALLTETKQLNISNESDKEGSTGKDTMETFLEKTERESKEEYQKKLESLINSGKEKLGVKELNADLKDSESVSSDLDENDSELVEDTIDDLSSEEESGNDETEGKKSDMDSNSVDSCSAVETVNESSQESLDSLKESTESKTVECVKDTKESNLADEEQTKELKKSEEEAQTEELEDQQSENSNDGSDKSDKMEEEKGASEILHKELNEKITDKDNGKSKDSDGKDKQIKENDMENDKHNETEGQKVLNELGVVSQDATSEKKRKRTELDTDTECSEENDTSKKSKVTLDKGIENGVGLNVHTVLDSSSGELMEVRESASDSEAGCLEIDLDESVDQDKEKSVSEKDNETKTQKQGTGDSQDKDSSNDKAAEIDKQSEKSSNDTFVTKIDMQGMLRAGEKQASSLRPGSSASTSASAPTLETDGLEVMWSGDSSEFGKLPTQPPAKPDVDPNAELPTSSKIAEKFSKKMLVSIQATLEEMCKEVMEEQVKPDNLDTLHKQLQLARWEYSTELNEIRHNFQLTMSELKACWVAEKEQILKSQKTQFDKEKEAAVADAKRKQWCASCGKEAIFYCCWNTSYCDYPCQQKHWPVHMHSCLQTNKNKPPIGAMATATSTVVSTALMASSVQTTVPIVTAAVSAPHTTEPDHLRLLQNNITAAIQREEERQGEARTVSSPKYRAPMSAPPMNILQNIRQPGSVQAMGSPLMFNMNPAVAQMPRQRFNVQPMMMGGQPHVSLQQSVPGVGPGAPGVSMGGPGVGMGGRMVFSQQQMVPQALYPVHVQPQQSLLFRGQQQSMMAYGMPRPGPF